MSSLPTFSFTTTAEEVATALASEIKGKNVLITGTSLNGLGFETARVIAKYANLYGELTDNVLDHLSDEFDLEALSQCALVSQSWRYHAQSAVFRTISLGVGLQGGFGLGILEVPPLGEVLNLFQRFHDVLVASPHLASHVRTLNLGLQPLPSEVLLDALTPNSWHEINHHVAEFLPLLHSLESLGLFPCGPNTHTFQLAPKLLNTFRDLLPTTLSFSNWCFQDASALTSLGASPALTSLKFIECEFRQPLSFIASPVLDRVEFDRCDGYQAFTSSQPPCVRYMTVKTAYTLESAPRALIGLAPYIEQGLSVVINTVHTSSPQLFSLTCFPHLRALNLSFLDVGFSATIAMTWLERTFAAFMLPSHVDLCLSWPPEQLRIMQRPPPRSGGGHLIRAAPLYSA
ncbi:hypothetical protein C8R46DRAFT_1224292 [Mycena filopes]|nr:hypothetical protein C8R46DRAFT_1224292 [Mycena filopes]